MEEDKIIEGILSRLMQVTDTNDDEGLAKELAVGKSTVASWRHRHKIPYKECLEIANRKRVTLDWLVTGRGPRDREPGMVAEETPPEYSKREKVLKEQERITSLVEKYNKMQKHNFQSDQLQAIEDFAFLMQFDEAEIRQLMALLQYF